MRQKKKLYCFAYYADIRNKITDARGLFMSDSNNTNELDSYGVWVKKPPRTVNTNNQIKEETDFDLPDFTELTEAVSAVENQQAQTITEEQSIETDSVSDFNPLDSEEIPLDEFIAGGVFDGDTEQEQLSSPATPEEEHISVNDFIDDSPQMESEDSTPTNDEVLDIDLSFDDVPATEITAEEVSPSQSDSFDIPDTEDVDLSEFGIGDISDSTDTQTDTDAQEFETEEVDLSEFGIDDLDSLAEEKTESEPEQEVATETEAVDLSEFGFSDEEVTENEVPVEQETTVDNTEQEIETEQTEPVFEDIQEPVVDEIPDTFDEETNSLFSEQNENTEEIDIPREINIAPVDETFVEQSFENPQQTETEEVAEVSPGDEDSVTQTDEVTPTDQLQDNFDTIAETEPQEAQMPYTEEPVIEQGTEALTQIDEPVFEQNTDTLPQTEETVIEQNTADLPQTSELASVVSMLKDVTAEITSLKQELSALKEQVSTISTKQNEQLSDSQQSAETTNELDLSSLENESESAFFSDAEANDTALSTEELNNIFNTAQFTEEQAPVLTDEMESQEPVLDNEQNTAQEEDILIESSSSDLINEDEVCSEDESTPLDKESFDDLFAPDPTISESLTDEKLDYLSKDSVSDEIEQPVEEENSIEDIKEQLSEPVLAAAEVIAEIPEEVSVESSHSEPMTNELKEEIKEVLSYMDKLLENLPEEKITEFANSENFEKYKKLFKELGIS